VEIIQHRSFLYFFVGHSATLPSPGMVVILNLSGISNSIEVSSVVLHLAKWSYIES